MFGIPEDSLNVELCVFFDEMRRVVVELCRFLQVLVVPLLLLFHQVVHATADGSRILLVIKDSNRIGQLIFPILVLLPQHGIDSSVGFAHGESDQLLHVRGVAFWFGAVDLTTGQPFLNESEIAMTALVGPVGVDADHTCRAVAVLLTALVDVLATHLPATFVAARTSTALRRFSPLVLTFGQRITPPIMLVTLINVSAISGSRFLQPLGTGTALEAARDVGALATMVARGLVPRALVHILTRDHGIALPSIRTGRADIASGGVFALGFWVTIAVVSVTFVDVPTAAAHFRIPRFTSAARVRPHCIGALGLGITHPPSPSAETLVSILTCALVVVSIEPSRTINPRIAPITSLIHALGTRGTVV